MGAGCLGKSKAYELQLDQPSEPPPTAEPVKSSPSKPHVPTPTVAELKARLKDLGWKIPAHVVEKSELLALVKEAEQQKATKDVSAPSSPSSSASRKKTPPAVQSPQTATSPPRINTHSASPASGRTTSPSRSVAELKQRLRELGHVVPTNIVEKAELQALVEEAERQATSSKTARAGPAAPPKPTAPLKLGSRLHELGVEVPASIPDPGTVRSILKEAEQKQPTVEVKGIQAEDVTMTCTRGAQGVARIEVQPSSTTKTDRLADMLGGDIKFDPSTWQRGENVGHGSFGSVFKALNPETGVIIAVKEVYLDLKSKSDEKLKESLENEIDLMRSLRHPNIVAYYGSSWANDHLWMALEYMPGGSISQVLEQFGPLDEQLIAEYTRQLLSGLEHLHTRSPYIVHRDIKGANVLVGMDSLVKLADFGCSKRAKETTSLTIEGSIPWMAPEVLTHSRYGRAGDIWSFGCLLIEMATAAAPWGHFDNIMAAILKIGMSGELPPIPDTLSDECKSFIRRCTQQDPGRRFSASELLSDGFVLDAGELPQFSTQSEKHQPVKEADKASAEEEEPLPEGWEKHWDPGWNSWYYWHNVSGRSVWERPTSITETEEAGEDKFQPRTSLS